MSEAALMAAGFRDASEVQAAVRKLGVTAEPEQLSRLRPRHIRGKLTAYAIAKHFRVAETDVYYAWKYLGMPKFSTFGEAEAWVSKHGIRDEGGQCGCVIL